MEKIEQGLELSLIDPWLSNS